MDFKSLCDITLCPHVTHFHYLCLVWLLRIDLAQLLCCCYQCWVRHVWADQSEETEYLGGGTLKRQELKQSLFRQGGIQSCSTRQCVCILIIKRCKPVQNRVMNLKMCIICQGNIPLVSSSCLPSSSLSFVVISPQFSAHYHQKLCVTLNVFCISLLLTDVYSEQDVL